MRKYYLLTAVLIAAIQCFAQTDSIIHRIYLIGDAGELYQGKHPVVDWLKENEDWNDEKNVAIFLGDNIYPLGMPTEGEPSYNEAKEILDYQMSLAKGKKSKVFFIPGNHDWKNGKLGGWQQALNEVNYINTNGQPNIQAYPTEGCPGPITVELSDKVVVVLIDSQWFLYLHDKPGPGSNCMPNTMDGFITELNEIVAAHPNQMLLLAMHHPMYSYGVHGGDYSWKEHLFPLTALNPNLYIPLPGLGSVYPITRGIFGNVQDVKHPLYQSMVNAIEEVLKKHPNPVQAAGHDHSLQLIMKDSIPYIVSGSGSNLSRVKSQRKGELMYADLRFGVAMLEVRKSGNVEVKFYNAESKSLLFPDYVQKLKKIDTLPVVISKDSIPVLPDSVFAVANSKVKMKNFRKIMFGKNYRQEWKAEVKVPVLDLGKELGGLTPQKQGGGKQTRSLRLVDSTDKEYVLRSVQKFPEAAIPEDLRSPLARDIVEEGISASYPYASLSVVPLAKAANVPPIRRKLLYIPDDPRLGRFRNTFKNSLAILEERQPEGIKKGFNTEELVLRLAKDNDDHVDQKAVLRARLLDNFIMDFDRHEDQWLWATRDTGKGKIYYPIPRDHDQAFYINQGIIPKLVKKPWVIPEIQGFRAEADNINTFNSPARNFDRFFLNGLNANEWKTQIDSFLLSMTDDVIVEALSMQPPGIQQYHSNNIVATLQHRRKYFANDMLEYYAFISKTVNIVGTNQKELFTIDKNTDGSVKVTVNKINKDGDVSSKIYDRVFDPKVTKELRIYGLQDSDSFNLSGGKTPIKIRVIGGSGNDVYNNTGNGKNVRIYDVTFEENTFHGDTSSIKMHVTPNPQMNMYNRLYYKYDLVHPGVSIAYNIDDGVYLGAQLETTLQGFRKEPYAVRHFVRANKALKTSSFRFQYEGDFLKAFKETDFLIRADVRAPINVTNFFGLGNETVYNKNQPNRIQYYRARYDIADVSLLFRRQLQSWMRVNYGPTFQFFKLEQSQNKDRYVSLTDINGLSPDDLYKRKVFAGAQLGFDIDSRNSKVVPTRGLLMTGNARQLFGINQYSHDVTQLKFDMRIFASFKQKAKLVYAIRLGGGHNMGDYAFQQAQYLGGTENLRGYRQYRFGGKTMAYNNLEIRYKIADFRTYLFPGSFGLFVFNDVGRVWVRHEASTDWHVGNGGGIWLSPVNRFVVTAAITRSKEYKALPLVTFGFQF